MLRNLPTRSKRGTLRKKLYRWNISYTKRDDPGKALHSHSVQALNPVACGVFFRSFVGDLSKIAITEIRAVGTHKPGPEKLLLFP